MGLSNLARSQIFAGTFAGLQRDLYFRLLGGVSAVAGMTVNDDGTLPGALSEVTTPQLVLGTRWANPVVGTPTTIQVPKAGGANIIFANSGATWANVCAYAITTDANPISPTNYVAGDPLTFFNPATNTYQVGAQSVVSGKSIVFDPVTNPIVERLGNPGPVTNPT